MKKIIASLFVLATLSVTASADFARVELGGGTWAQTPSGDMSYAESTGSINYVSGEKSEASVYAWALVKHPVPVIPNVRLEYSNVKDEGSITGTGKIGDYELTTPSTTASFTFTQYDVIPYYNILDNTFWTTVDLGVDVKVLTTDYVANDVNVSGVPNSEYKKTIGFVLPMAYVRARVQIPSTDLGIEGDVKYVSYDGSTVYDARIKVDYTFDITPVVQPGVEIGYRMQKFDLTSTDDKTKINLNFSGVYAGIMLRF